MGNGNTGMFNSLNKAPQNKIVIFKLTIKLANAIHNKAFLICLTVVFQLLII